MRINIGKDAQGERLTLDVENMTEYLSSVMSNGDFGDEDESDGQGNGMARFGRRIFRWDDQGFEDSDIFDTVELAAAAFTRAALEGYHSKCEKCGEVVHNDESSWYEHTKDECGTEDYNFLRVTIAGWDGVAWAIVKTYPIIGRIDMVMVGDDRVFNHDWNDATIIDHEDYCGGCGQIGCGW